MSYKTNVIAGLYHPFDYESVTFGSLAIGLTEGTYAPATGGKATRVVITIETAQIRYRYDGTDPASDEGHILNQNDVLTLIGTKAISQFRGIATTATSGVGKCTFER